MRSKSNSDPSARNPTAPAQTTAATSVYSPSVPISVYRELAAELQATKTLLESLNTQNQQLTRHNQQLRQEIERVVQATLNLQQIAGSFQTKPESEPAETPVTYEVAEMIRPSSPRPVQRPSRPASVAVEASPPPLKSRAADAELLSDELFTEQEEVRHRPMTQSQPPKDLGGLWLIVTILAIVITAFGTGFLVVRPFTNR